MAVKSVQAIIPGGLAPSYSAVGSSDTAVLNASQRSFLHVKNGGGSSINVTIPAVKTSAKVPGVGVVAIANQVIAVAAGAEKMIGPFTEAYLDTNGTLTMQYSATTSVTAAVISLPAVY